MPSQPHKAQHSSNNRKTLKQTFKLSKFAVLDTKKILTLLVMTFIYSSCLSSLIACSQPGNENDGSDQSAKIEILPNEVIVDKSYIYTSNTERYQPSYNLYGALIPIEQITLETPFEATDTEILVKKGDWVNKGQLLAKMQSQLEANQINNFDNEFIKIDINTTELNQNLLNINVTDNSLDNKTEHHTQPANNSTSPLTDKSHHINNDKTDDDGQNDNLNLVTTTAIPKFLTTITYSAPIAGEIIDINIKPSTAIKPASINTDSDDKTVNTPSSIASKTKFITIANTRQLQLIGTLPISAEPHLSVGQSVNFTIYDAHTEFTGQISHVIKNIKNKTVIVRAPVLPSVDNKTLLESGMRASMSIEYGDAELGVRVPRFAIHEAFLGDLTKKQPRPVSPISGYVWVIKHDKTLSYTPVKIVEYFPESDKFLVNGINNHSLVCLADLPKSSHGKKISVD